MGAYASYSYSDALSEGSMRWGGGGGGGGGDSYSYGPLPSPGADDYGSYYSYYDDASASYSYAPAADYGSYSAYGNYPQSASV